MPNCVRNRELTVLNNGQCQFEANKLFYQWPKKKNYEPFMDKLPNQNSSEAGK